MARFPNLMLPIALVGYTADLNIFLRALSNTYSMHSDAVDRVERQMVQCQSCRAMHLNVARRHVVNQRGNCTPLAELLSILGPIAAICYGYPKVCSQVVIRCAHCENDLISITLTNT